MSEFAHLREPPLLTGRRVLIVEDEYFLADDMRSALRALGADIAGPAGDIDDALRILHDGGVIDGAVLDVNIRKQMIYPVARELQARGVPIVFTSGYDKIVLGTEFAGVPLWEKPFDQRAMAHGLAGMILRGDPAKTAMLYVSADRIAECRQLADEADRKASSKRRGCRSSAS
ncbi:response regulator [Bradyrhizobium elkanii]|uniref:DNA-binding response OmpR family regulator n=1 Tax=Bradyrhizobium elkanii TaxID=29448 RepID=A0A8I1YG12_BRAEL|nr:response regulator [Bradyrhizobium elkanii]MBP1297521.1 DNA-binding response OmpR family regulator [Bradyrhizobium elkanii]